MTEDCICELALGSRNRKDVEKSALHDTLFCFIYIRRILSIIIKGAYSWIKVLI